ncbi:hypothetical protein HPB50_014141 [Hyalomma asiaticum]|uniref:Uncharacterized protein n=1 Tax=Hyalomma asiaticum TaxID=266040 RepID=A0ACB7RNK7_HYAAI|nr:hypothetical protein HPB50_014141 [Hyalomma asiaticum]
MLRTRLPVKRARISHMSLREFKLVLDDLEKCESLTDLCLGVVCEGEGLGKDLWRVFRNLHSLELECDNTGSDLAQDVGSYIRQSKSLREVALQGSCGGDEGAAHLIEPLERNDTLRKLTLCEMTLSCETLISFAKI